MSHIKGAYFWMHNDELNKERLFRYGEEIPDGWEKGRFYMPYFIGNKLSEEELFNHRKMFFGKKKAPIIEE